MAWEAWVLFLLFATNVILQPVMVGRPRSSTGAVEATVAVATSIFFAWLVLRLAGVA